MQQMWIGLGIGVFGLLGLATVAGTLYLLVSLRRAMLAMIDAVNRNTEGVKRSGDHAAALQAMLGVNRKLISSVEGMTAAIKVFNSLVLRDRQMSTDPDDEPAPPQPSWGAPRPWTKPPAPPFTDAYPATDEAGVLSQSEEEMAAVEFQREAQERGEPTETDILGMQEPGDIRAEV